MGVNTTNLSVTSVTGRRRQYIKKRTRGKVLSEASPQDKMLEIVMTTMASFSDKSNVRDEHLAGITSHVVINLQKKIML